MSFASMAQNLKNQKTVSLEMVTGYNMQGQPIYAFVAVRKDMLEDFKQTIHLEGGDPSESALILETGVGHPSPAEVLAMRERYCGIPASTDRLQ